MFKIRIPIGILLLSTLGGIGYLDYYTNTAYPTKIVIGILILGALWEFYRLLARRGYALYVHYGMLIALLGLLLYITFPQSYFPITYYYGSAVVMALLLRGLLDSHEEKVLEKTALTGLGLLYIVLLLSHLFLLRDLGGENLHGIVYVLLLVLVAKGTDIGGYLVGTLIGKHKLYPHVSPKKSWEGFGGGMFVSIGFAFAIRAAFPFLAQELSISITLLFAVIISVLSLLGDLLKSLVKRRCSAKDSSNLIPEFGGILDLVDSLILTAPAAYAFLLILRIF